MIGVSGDAVRNQALFKKAHNLTFPLLSDEKGEVARKFGVPLGDGGKIEKEVDGKLETLVRGVTARRWTFIISPDGKVAYKNTTVSAKDDSRSVIEALGKLLPKAPGAGGLQRLFDGASLGPWDGDPRLWRVEDGAIVGETTAERKAEEDTFLVYRGGEFGDFELRFRFKVEGYSSAVQYRSVETSKWKVHGYQADFEAPCHDQDGRKVDLCSGMLFEEGGRLSLAQRGQAVVVRSDPSQPHGVKVEVLGSTGEAAALESAIRRDDWNEYIIIASGPQLTHLINGHVMAIARDEDREHRRSSGLLAFQLHAGPPMKIQLKDIRIRALD